jgi:hypothetical protein
MPFRSDITKLTLQVGHFIFLFLNYYTNIDILNAHSAEVLIDNYSQFGSNIYMPNIEIIEQYTLKKYLKIVKKNKILEMI